MFGLLDYLKLGAGALVGAALMAAPAYFYGKAAGKSEITASLQSDRITILKDGTKIDAEALTADDTSLCTLLGGCELPDDGESH